jgi:hypothetical protein
MNWLKKWEFKQKKSANIDVTSTTQNAPKKTVKARKDSAHNGNHPRDTRMTTSHNNAVSTHHTRSPYNSRARAHTHTHTQQPDYITQYLLQNNNKKIPRRDNPTGNHPYYSGNTKNEDPQAAHKPRIWPSVPPKLTACKNSR